MPFYKPQRFHLQAPNRRQTGKKINSRPKKMPRSPRFYLVLLKMQTSAVTRDILGGHERKKAPLFSNKAPFFGAARRKPLALLGARRKQSLRVFVGCNASFGPPHRAPLKVTKPMPRRAQPRWMLVFWEEKQTERSPELLG